MSPSDPGAGATTPAQLRDELARLILHEEPSLTAEEVTDGSGMTPETLERLWRALGFADPGNTAAYSMADLRALIAMSDTVNIGGIDEDTAYRMARALGQTMARLADWEVTLVVEHIERQRADHSIDSRLERSVEVARAVEPAFEEFLIYVWRRHLAAAAARVEALGAQDAELLSTSMTVGFADLSRFSALSNHLSDSAIGDLVENFETRATDVVTAHGGRVIKALGDAVLYVNTQPVEATYTAIDLVQHIGSREDLPDVRVGLATGSVLSRLGDVFGPPVNLAARLSNVARSNRVLVDEATAAHLDTDEFDLRRLPARPLRGFGEVEPLTVTRRRTFRMHQQTATRRTR